MPHYRDGTAAKVGDVVRGKGYNVRDKAGNLKEIVGTVVGVTPGSDTCNIQVAHVVTEPLAAMPSSYFFRQQENVVIGCGPEGGTAGPQIAARVSLEYGQCDAFEKIA